MKTFYITLLICVSTVSATFSQSREEKAKLKYEAEMEQKKQDYINGFVSTLKVDDFQKQIIVQTMESYFKEYQKINLMGLKDFERQGFIDQLDIRHFADLRTMLSEENMSEIMNAVQGKWKKESKKDKKKRKRKQEGKN